MTYLKKWAKYLNRHLSNDDMQMDDKHMKRFSTSLAIGEVQMKDHHELPLHTH